MSMWTRKEQDRQMQNTLILTGWGWKEYSVAAAAALRALKGMADVRGVSKRRLPEMLEELPSNYKKVVIVGVALGGDPARIENALKRLKKRNVSVYRISAFPMEESLQKTLSGLIDERVVDGFVAPDLDALQCGDGGFQHLTADVGVGLGLLVGEELHIVFR